MEPLTLTLTHLDGRVAIKMVMERTVPGFLAAVNIAIVYATWTDSQSLRIEVSGAGYRPDPIEEHGVGLTLAAHTLLSGADPDLFERCARELPRAHRGLPTVAV